MSWGLPSWQRNGTRDGDWPMYSRDATGSRFSPLADINAGNVSQLTQAWSVPLTTPGGRRGGGQLRRRQLVARPMDAAQRPAVGRVAPQTEARAMAMTRRP